MPFVLIFVGLVLVIAAIEGTEQALGAQLKKDFSGQGSFLLWAAAIVAVGSIGYVPELKKFSDTFLVLLLVSLLFSNPAALGNIASEIQSAAASPVRRAPRAPRAPRARHSHRFPSSADCSAGAARAAELIRPWAQSQMWHRWRCWRWHSKREIQSCPTSSFAASLQS
jgi:hypothetical protein